MCLVCSMMQQDLFAVPPSATPQQMVMKPAAAPAGMPALLDQLSAVSTRPRYAFMVLTLIAKASAGTGRAGPYVREGDDRVPVREWLCDALVPMARRDPRRIALTANVREELERAAQLPADVGEAERVVQAEVRDRVRRSGKTQVSRAVSELVRAGLLKRHYQGWCVDHVNRGAQREAVYTLLPETRAALSAI